MNVNSLLLLLLYGGFLPLLKVFNIVSISWIFALSPMWVPMLTFLSLMLFIVVPAILAEMFFLIFPDKQQ